MEHKVYEVIFDSQMEEPFYEEEDENEVIRTKMIIGDYMGNEGGHLFSNSREAYVINNKYLSMSKLMKGKQYAIIGDNNLIRLGAPIPKFDNEYGDYRLLKDDGELLNHVSRVRDGKYQIRNGEETFGTVHDLWDVYNYVIYLRNKHFPPVCKASQENKRQRTEELNKILKKTRYSDVKTVQNDLDDFFGFNDEHYLDDNSSLDEKVGYLEKCVQYLQSYLGVSYEESLDKYKG